MKPKIISNIYTPRLLIRPIMIDDADAYFEAEQVSFKEISPHWSWVQIDKSVNDVKAFILDALECHKKELPVEMYFSIFSKEHNTFLGAIWFFEINWFVPTFEIAYWLDTREMNKGYMTEAVNALSQACFLFYNAKRVQIKISADNTRSIKVAKKLGFQLEGEMKNYFINFVTKRVINGLLFSCCDISILPTLTIDVQ